MCKKEKGVYLEEREEKGFRSGGNLLGCGKIESFGVKMIRGDGKHDGDQKNMQNKENKNDFENLGIEPGSLRA